MSVFLQANQGSLASSKNKRENVDSKKSKKTESKGSNTHVYTERNTRENAIQQAKRHKKQKERGLTATTKAK